MKYCGIICTLYYKRSAQLSNVLIDSIIIKDCLQNVNNNQRNRAYLRTSTTLVEEIPKWRPMLPSSVLSN